MFTEKIASNLARLPLPMVTIVYLQKSERDKMGRNEHNSHPTSAWKGLRSHEDRGAQNTIQLRRNGSSRRIRCEWFSGKVRFNLSIDNQTHEFFFRIRIASEKPPKALQSDSEDSDDEELTPEQQAKKREFELKRKKHYNEFHALQVAKKLLEEEEDDEDEEESPSKGAKTQDESSSSSKYHK